MSSEYSRAILSALTLNAALLESSDFATGDFPEGHERETFQAITKIWEELREPTIPLPLILAEANGNGMADFLVNLAPIPSQSTPAAFAYLVRQFRREQTSERILKLTQDEGQQLVKTGEIDPTYLQEIKAAFAELEGLDAKQGFDPYAFMRTGSQLQALDIKVEWVVNKLIPKGAITLLHGPGGQGKTWLCLALAKAISEGAPFLGLETKQREVVYCDYENPLSVDHDRACALDVRAPHFWHLSDPVRPPTLDGPDWHLLKSLRPGSLIIIDTARGATDGDEILGKDVALVMNHLKELREMDHEIVLQAHTSKADRKRSKGATTWEDLADHVLAFYRVDSKTLEELDQEGLNPNGLLYLGTGNKTRYEPSRFYVSLDASSGTFTLADNPDLEILKALADHVAGEGLGKNQGEIIGWAKKNLTVGKLTNFLGLLNRGERDGLWHHRSGLKGAKLYEPGPKR
jgi:energy-coupling factor transporter ATP-binding protein EcfA2